MMMSGGTPLCCKHMSDELQRCKMKKRQLVPAESPGSLGGGLSDFSDEEGAPVPAAGIGGAGLGEPLPACTDAITRTPFLSQIACQKPYKNQCSAGSDMWARIQVRTLHHSTFPYGSYRGAIVTFGSLLPCRA